MTETTKRKSEKPEVRAVREFTYLLNAMEHAAQSENPAANGYAEKRAAVLAYVWNLAARRPAEAGQ